MVRKVSCPKLWDLKWDLGGHKAPLHVSEQGVWWHSVSGGARPARAFRSLGKFLYREVKQVQASGLSVDWRRNKCQRYLGRCLAYSPVLSCWRWFYTLPQNYVIIRNHTLLGRKTSGYWYVLHALLAVVVVIGVYCEREGGQLSSLYRLTPVAHVFI